MKRPALALIRWYQRRISGGLPPSCRFQPTCSQYAYDAIEAYGVVRGGAMAAWRILRCNPLNDGGFDPVQPRRPRTPQAPT
jgi:putative membrane protein insertion efficiency factor